MSWPEKKRKCPFFGNRDGVHDHDGRAQFQLHRPFARFGFWGLFLLPKLKIMIERKGKQEMRFDDVMGIKSNVAHVIRETLKKRLFLESSNNFTKEKKNLHKKRKGTC